MKKQNKQLLQGLGIYEMAGGAIGIGMLVWTAIQQTNTISFLLITFGCILYIISIIAGICLFRGNLQIGKRLSMFTQGLQIIYFGIGGFAYLFISGIRLSIDINLAHGFGINIGAAISQFNLFFTNSPLIDNSIIGINFVPIIFVYMLDKTIKNIERNNQVQRDIEDMQKQFRNNS